MINTLKRIYWAICDATSKPKENSKQKKFREDMEKYKSFNQSRFPIEEEHFYPCLDDATEYTGFDAHYVYHPAWAARIVKQINPSLHIDISSTLHFCSIISAFVDVKFYDYRPAKLNLSNLSSERVDLTNMFFDDESVDCISCMHTVEHIGLGRYGDPIDSDGDKKAIMELKRVVKKGGNLLFVIPVGKPKLMFNAHRIYSYEMIEELFEGFDIKEFSMVYDDTSFVRNANPNDVQNQNYACGCFWLMKT